jgi:hypothetical protein
MTPKEKAIELVDKMNFPYLNGEDYTMTYYQQKQCALIAVDEILAIFYDDYQSMWVRELNFWHLVKQEIEAL